MDTTLFSVITAVTIGLTEVLKRVCMPDRFVPLTAVLIAVALSVTFDPERSVLLGLVAGLTSCGLYSGTKATLK
jgi:hypothetical protein